jgi:hypothetical protein
MTGESFRTKIFYSETGEHVLTLFFGTCLAYAGIRMVANGEE